MCVHLYEWADIRLVGLCCCVTPRLLGSLWRKRCRGLLDISSLWSTSWLPFMPDGFSLLVVSVPSIASWLYYCMCCALVGGRQNKD